MNAQTDAGATDVSEETEPVSKATEQETDSGLSFQDQLLQTAKEEGHEIGDAPPEAEETPEAEAPAATEETETETETEPKTEGVTEGKDAEDEEEEEKPAAKKGDEWPDSAKQRVAEETAKRKRANERADKAEALALELQTRLSKVVAPQPTEDDPFRDIQSIPELKKMEKSYEDAIDVLDRAIDQAEVDGEAELAIGDKTQKLTYAQLKEKRRQAEKSVRTFIPERRHYLEERAIADAQAVEVYPELKDPDSEFTQQCAVLAQRLFNGEAMKSPDVLVWIGHAVKGYRDSLQKNGKAETAMKSPEAERILKSSKQKIAPTPTKTRTLAESPRSRSSSEVAKANKKLEQEGSEEAALKVLEAMRLGQGKATGLEPIPD